VIDLKRQADNWIRFLRQYGPVPQNENMYDEHIRRSAARADVEPLHFDHPARTEVMGCFLAPNPVSAVLTGTAGDGKTHLCRQVWEAVGGDAKAWQSASPYLSTTFRTSEPGASTRTLHMIRDLSAWAPQRGASWSPEKETLLQRFSAAGFGTGQEGDQSGDAGDGTAELYLIAANDGQLIESWHRLPVSPAILRAREGLETLLVEDRQQLPGANLRFYNLSRSNSAALFDRAVAALLNHPGWEICRQLAAGPGEFYGPACPIRRNVELLATPQVHARLRALLALCDYSRVHIPIRQILLLLTNAVLGHPDMKDRLMTAESVPAIIRTGSVAKSSLYSNVFGGNLTESRRESSLIFEALDRFGIGHETTNRVDNILIYGDVDEALRPYFDRFMVADSFYGADPSFRAAQREYVEGADEDEQRSAAFLRALIAQRRGLFFKIPDAEAEELRLWELTVFRFAGEYLSRVVAALEAGRRVDRPVLSRIVRGLNRVFTGMLIGNDRDLLLATSIAFSHGRVSRLLEERVSVEPRLGERVDIIAADGIPTLEVTLDATRSCRLPLHLTRFEFLSRVADGALPSSFSKECYEDILAFKSQLLAAITDRRRASGEERPELALQLLEVDEAGKAAVFDLEVLQV
jgi:hypothetical protein